MSDEAIEEKKKTGEASFKVVYIRFYCFALPEHRPAGDSASR